MQSSQTIVTKRLKLAYTASPLHAWLRLSGQRRPFKGWLMAYLFQLVLFVLIDYFSCASSTVRCVSSHSFRLLFWLTASLFSFLTQMLLSLTVLYCLKTRLCLCLLVCLFVNMFVRVSACLCLFSFIYIELIYNEKHQSMVHSWLAIYR